MNPYEINELESRDLYCAECGILISTQTYIENESICDKCLEKENIKMKLGNELLNNENRIALLQGRTGKENGKIVKKLLRRQRKLASK